MNEYEIEYMMNVLKNSSFNIEDELTEKAFKIKNNRVKKALKIYLTILTFFLIILFKLYITIKISDNIKLVFVAIAMLTLIFLQKMIVDKICEILKKKEYKKNLSDEFIERVEKQYGYRY